MWTASGRSRTAGRRRRVDRTFVDAVQGKEADVRVPYREALKTHRLALALARSARGGEPVKPDG